MLQLPTRRGHFHFNESILIFFRSWFNFNRSIFGKMKKEWIALRLYAAINESILHELLIVNYGVVVYYILYAILPHQHHQSTHIFNWKYGFRSNSITFRWRASNISSESRIDATILITIPPSNTVNVNDFSYYHDITVST